MNFLKRLKQTITSKTDEVTEKFRSGLEKTCHSLAAPVSALFQHHSKIEEEFFEELEEILLGADVGVNTVFHLIDSLRTDARKLKLKASEELQPLLAEKVLHMLKGSEADLQLHENRDGITVILFVGVNGSGKTTTIGKLADRYRQQGKKVLLAAGDTFRAGAIEQLEVWGKRVGAEVVKQASGADPSAVIYDALQAAKRRHVDILICDTAGRLQNKTNLMEELNKIYRVIRREIPNAPHETLLVLDATTGQNALQQARVFGEKTGVTGLVLTKLDGTSKGGIVLGIRDELQLPVKLIGLGEKTEDLQIFDAESFTAALFSGIYQRDA